METELPSSFLFFHSIEILLIAVAFKLHSID